MIKWKKLAHKQDFEQANIIKQRIASLELLQQEQSVNSKTSSADFFACTSSMAKLAHVFYPSEMEKLRGTKTYYFKDDLLGEIDPCLRVYILLITKINFSLPEKIIFTMKSIIQTYSRKHSFKISAICRYLNDYHQALNQWQN